MARTRHEAVRDTKKEGRHAPLSPKKHKKSATKLFSDHIALRNVERTKVTREKHLGESLDERQKIIGPGSPPGAPLANRQPS
jgi:hypothetical protein